MKRSRSKKFWRSIQNRKDLYKYKRSMARIRRLRVLHGGLPCYTEGLGGYYIKPNVAMRMCDRCRIGKTGRINIPTWRIIEQARERREQ